MVPRPLMAREKPVRRREAIRYAKNRAMGAHVESEEIAAGSRVAGTAGGLQEVLAWREQLVCAVLLPEHPAGGRPPFCMD